MQYKIDEEKKHCKHEKNLPLMNKSGLLDLFRVYNSHSISKIKLVVLYEKAEKERPLGENNHSSFAYEVFTQIY